MTASRYSSSKTSNAEKFLSSLSNRIRLAKQVEFMHNKWFVVIDHHEDLGRLAEALTPPTAYDFIETTSGSAISYLPNEFILIQIVSPNGDTEFISLLDEMPFFKGGYSNTKFSHLNSELMRQKQEAITKGTAYRLIDFGRTQFPFTGMRELLLAIDQEGKDERTKDTATGP